MAFSSELDASVSLDVSVSLALTSVNPTALTERPPATVRRARRRAVARQPPRGASAAGATRAARSRTRSSSASSRVRVTTRDPRPAATAVTGRRLVPSARALTNIAECLGNARNGLRSGAAGALTPAASDDVDAMAPRVAHACAREAVRPGREPASVREPRCAREVLPAHLSFREGETKAELEREGRRGERGTKDWPEKAREPRPRPNRVCARVPISARPFFSREIFFFFLTSDDRRAVAAQES